MTTEIGLDAEVGTKHQEKYHYGQNVVLAYNRGREWITVRRTMGLKWFFHRGRSVAHRCSSLRMAAALEKGEDNHYNSDSGKISHTFLLMYQQRCQQEVMGQKQYQKEGEYLPHNEHLSPVENEVGGADSTDIETQQWGQEE
jgi:hypothetical protein